MKPPTYPDYFDQVHCDAETKSHEYCRLIPAWVVRATGERLCYVHAARRFADLTTEEPEPDDGKTLIAGVLYDNETGEEADPQ